MNKLAINRLTVNSIHVNNINVNALQKGLLTGYYSGHVDPTRPVIWNPEIQFSNPADSYVFQIWNGSTWEDMVIGQSYAGQSLFRLIVNTTGMDEVSAAVYNSSYMRLDIEATSEHQYVFEGNLNDVTPQQFTVTVDIFIRFEDIVQPYPSFVKLENLDRTHTYTWGDKLRVGDTIRYNSSKNLLAGAYTLRGQLECNGVYVFDNNQRIVVTKEMVFAWSHSPVWTFDNNEPKCILSPSRLRIPNSSYKILSHMPDISGHGNHGVIHNSAYEGMSGVNGYPVVFGKNKTWANESNVYVTNITSNTIHITNVLNAGLALLYSYVKYNGNIQNIKEIPPFKIEIKGLEGRSKFIYKYLATSNATKETNLYLGNGTHELPKSFLPTEALINNAVVGFSISPIAEGVTEFDCDITIEVLPDYEGAYCFDGVDDFVSIPTLSIGGKQVLMKTNWLKSPALLYDQRASGGFAILTTNEDDATNPRIAYQARNQDGKTYIDGIENNYIETYALKGITHNITVTNPSAGSGVVPVIGANTGKSNSFAKMSLYDFMLFDEISTDEEIKRLNDIVGIEGGYVQKPPYYWDAYGKTNSDDDRSTIQQRGTAVGDYDLTNHNHAYEGMSGYNGYPIILSGTNRTYQDKASYVNVVGDDKNIISITRISFTTAAIFSYIKQNGILTDYNRNIESFKVKVTGLQYDKFVVKYNYINSVDATARTVISITSDGIYELPKSFASDGSLTSDNVWIGLHFTKQSADMPDIIEDVNVTIEVLPEYENGLAYDGEDDYSENINIPAFTDYTYIFKRTLLNKKYSSASAFKGSNRQSGGGAFICDYNSAEPDLRILGYSFGAGLYVSSLNTDNIIYGTRDSVNGQTITSGNNADTEGLTIGKWTAYYKQMVFYKLMLYPRTTDMLTINMIKNMMEEDGIIDLTHPIFIPV